MVLVAIPLLVRQTWNNVLISLNNTVLVMLRLSVYRLSVLSQIHNCILCTTCFLQIRIAKCLVPRMVLPTSNIVLLGMIWWLALLGDFIWCIYLPCLDQLFFFSSFSNMNICLDLLLSLC